jgi:hypothetical protein
VQTRIHASKFDRIVLVSRTHTHTHTHAHTLTHTSLMKITIQLRCINRFSPCSSSTRPSYYGGYSGCRNKSGTLITATNQSCTCTASGRRNVRSSTCTASGHRNHHVLLRGTATARSNTCASGRSNCAKQNMYCFGKMQQKYKFGARCTTNTQNKY